MFVIVRLLLPQQILSKDEILVLPDRERQVAAQPGVNKPKIKPKAIIVLQLLDDKDMVIPARGCIHIVP